MSVGCAIFAFALTSAVAYSPLPPRTPYVDIPKSTYRVDPRPEDFSPQPESATPGPACCRPGEACWPSKDDVKALSDALDPQAKRNLHWDGGENPIPAPFAAGTFQPLFGMNTNLKPVYERTLSTNISGNCVVPFTTDLCKAATRNLPAENWEPAFVVWPLNAVHVQKAILFAQKHQLCMSVAGTGHDFLNRHSTNNGLMIRTTLLKEMDWSLEGAVRLGSGHTFSEITKAGSEQQPSVFTATGWASTVGIAGWSLGGGHGPLIPSVGSGVDNVLEVEIVLANGTLVTASPHQNSDLLWALRGGGGSTWGVVTSFTVRKHLTPKGGFTGMTVPFGGSSKNMSEAELQQVVDHCFDWALGLSEKWGGLMFAKTNPVTSTWNLELLYWYPGAETDAEFQEQFGKLTNGPVKPQSPNITNYPNWWAANLPSREKDDYLETWVIPYKVTGDTIPSALINRSTVATTDFRTQVVSWIQDSAKSIIPLGTLEVYQCLPHPNVSKHFPPNATSVSPGWYNGMIHLISTPDKKSRQRFAGLGDNSYFAESAYYHPGDSWKQRYWGPKYEKLLAIKKKYDPDNFFWCHNCVGSDLPRRSAMPRPETVLSAIVV